MLTVVLLFLFSFSSLQISYREKKRCERSKMLSRLVLKNYASTQQLVKTLPRVFSTTPTAVSQVSNDKFYLRHQLDSKHVSGGKWKIRRFAAVGLLGGLTACFICPGNAVVDFATVSLLVYHNYTGINSVISDYFPLFFPQGIVKATMNLWLLISILTLALLYSYNYNNVGFSKSLVAFFKL